MTKVVKMLSIINLRNMYSWVISKSNMDAIRDLGLIDIKRY